MFSSNTSHTHIVVYIVLMFSSNTSHTHIAVYIVLTCLGSCRPLIKVFIFDLSLRYLWGRLDFFFIWGSSAFLQQKTSNSESSQFYTSSLGTSTYFTVFHLYIYIYICTMYLLHCVMKEVTNLLRLNCEAATVSSFSVDMDPCVSASPLYVCLKSDISKITRGLTRCYTKNKPVSSGPTTINWKQTLARFLV